jgi:hypothetical protein
METIDDTVKNQKTSFSLGCSDCTYLTFDAIIKDSDRTLIKALQPKDYPFDSVYTACIQSVLKKISPNTHGIVGIFDSKNNHHIIADLYHNRVILKDNDSNEGCNTISGLKAKMNELAKNYKEKHDIVQQILITDRTTPCCEKQAINKGNLHLVEDIYRR